MSRANRARPDAANRREEILDAALKLFAEQGYAGTPVPEIAREVGLAVGGLYRYYASKELLANAVYQRAMLRCTDALLEGFERLVDVKARFHHLWQKMHLFAMESPDDFVFLELHNHSTYLNMKSEQADARLNQVLDEYVRFGQKKGSIRKFEPPLVISIVLNIYLGYFKSVQYDELKNRAASLKEAEHAAWRAIAH